MNTAEYYTSGTSQRELAAGVLKQAEQDLRQFHNATSRVEREIYADVYRWFTTHDCSSPFSFLNVCQLLNLSPDVVRQELLGDASLGFFGYWTRRCLRAARSFQNFRSRALTSKRTSKPVDPVPLTHAFR